MASRVSHHGVAKAGSLCECAEVGDLQALQQRAARIVDELGYPLHEVLSERDTLLGAQPMHFAAENGHLDVIMWLLEHKVLPSPGDAHMVSPLQLASLGGHLDVVQALLKGGAPVRLADHDGDTALHWAAQNGHVEVMEALVQAGAVVDAVNAKQLTPLHRASLKNHPQAVNWLLSHGADVNAVDERGHTALHMACYYCAFNALDALLSAGAKPDVLDQAGLVCWQLAPSGGKAAKALIQQRQAEAADTGRGRARGESGGQPRSDAAPPVRRDDAASLPSEPAAPEDRRGDAAGHPPSRLPGLVVRVDEAPTPAVLASTSPTFNAMHPDVMLSLSQSPKAKGTDLLDDKRHSMTSYLREASHGSASRHGGHLAHLNSALGEFIDEDSAADDDADSSCLDPATGGDPDSARPSEARDAAEPVDRVLEALALGADSDQDAKANARRELDRVLSSSSGKQRPNEANRKFLNRYGLGDAKLFTP